MPILQRQVQYMSLDQLMTIRDNNYQSPIGEEYNSYDVDTAIQVKFRNQLQEQLDNEMSQREQGRDILLRFIKQIKQHGPTFLSSDTMNQITSDLQPHVERLS